MADTTVHLGFSSYKPLEGEDYLNENQLAHLEKILLAWQQSLASEGEKTVSHMR